MDDGRLSIDTVKRDLGTLMYLGLVIPSKTGKQIYTRYNAVPLTEEQHGIVD